MNDIPPPDDGSAGKASPAANSQTGEPAQRLIKLYDVYRQYLNHEHSLINQRLGWNFTIQGFFFTAYAFVLNKVADVRVALSQKPTFNTAPDLGSLHELRFLLVVIAAAACVSSIAIGLSVLGARLAMETLTVRWKDLKYDETQTLAKYSESVGYPHIVGGGEPMATKLSFYAPVFLSMALAAVWVLLLADQLR